jgi:hypothetical protein
MNRRATLATGIAVATAAAGLTPALATASKARPKPLKGSWSFTDTTPDPAVTVLDAAGKRSGYCVGEVPSSPADVNTAVLKTAGPGTLTVRGTTTGDWAMELRDKKNNLLGGSDGATPQDQEGVTGVALRKAGSYKIVFCNLGGSPAATATYSFIYR